MRERRYDNMRLLNLKEQREIVEVINYLLEIQTKNVTVAELMEKFGISFDEYRMCCNLAKPAMMQGNMAAQYNNMRKVCTAMRKAINEAWEAVQGTQGPAADAVRKLYETHVYNGGSVVYGKSEDESDGDEAAEDGDA